MRTLFCFITCLEHMTKVRAVLSVFVDHLSSIVHVKGWPHDGAVGQWRAGANPSMPPAKAMHNGPGLGFLSEAAEDGWPLKSRFQQRTPAVKPRLMDAGPSRKRSKLPSSLTLHSPDFCRKCSTDSCYSHHQSVVMVYSGGFINTAF